MTQKTINSVIVRFTENQSNFHNVTLPMYPNYSAHHMATANYSKRIPIMGNNCKETNFIVSSGFVTNNFWYLKLQTCSKYRPKVFFICSTLPLFRMFSDFINDDVCVRLSSRIKNLNSSPS